MNYILALGFDFSVDKFANPVVIIGLILLVAAVFLVGGATKIDERIQEKRREKKRASSSAVKGEEPSNNEADVFDAKSTADDSEEQSTATINEGTKSASSITEDTASTDSSDRGISEDIDDESEELTSKETSRLKGNMESEEGELSMFRHKDGSLNAYMIIKIVGLVSVIVAAIMIVVGMK